MNVINYDFRLDEDGDLFINDNGDFDIVDSNKQLCDSLVQSTTADWKQNPDYALNLYQELGGSSSRIRIDQKTRKLMDKDGFVTQDLQIIYDNENLSVKTNASRNR